MSFLSRILHAVAPPARRRHIEAGAGGRRWEGASTLTAPHVSSLAARGPVKARSAALYLNSAQGNRAVEAWVSAMAGKGWQARPQNLDPIRRRDLAEAFEALSGPLLIELVRSLVRDGEAFIQITLRPDGTLRLKHLTADQIDPSLTRDLGNGGRIVAGVEFDADDEVVAYHVLRDAPGTPFTYHSDPIRVPAADMIHVFDRLFPGQVRGLSWLAPVLLKMRDRDETADALLMQAKVASLITGFISDPEGGNAGFEGEASSNALNVALEPGAMRILPNGAEVKFSTPGQGVTHAVDFLRSIDREIAAGLGITFEMLTGDLGEANYSSARVGLLEFRRRAEMLQKHLIEGQFLRPLWRRWIEAKALSGEITSEEVADHMAVRFVPPGWQWVDPKNEVEAEVAAIDAGLKSREEVVAGRGRDIDELDEERARDSERQNGGNQE